MITLLRTLLNTPKLIAEMQTTIDSLNEKVATLKSSINDQVDIESEIEKQLESAIENIDLSSQIEDEINNADLSSAIEDAIRDYDFSDDVRTAIDDYNLVGREVESILEDKDFVTKDEIPLELSNFDLEKFKELVKNLKFTIKSPVEITLVDGGNS